jgi:hypothetical protein
VAREKARGPRAGPAGRKERARAFAFEGFSEHDRFGVFDPALRASFVLAVLFAVVFGVGWTFEGLRGSGGAPAAAAAVAAAVAALGAVGYRRIWRKPAERELLLSMAREDEEARALRARAANGAAGARESANAPDGERPHE